MVMSVDGRIWGSRWRPKSNVIPGLFEKLPSEHYRRVEETPLLHEVSLDRLIIPWQIRCRERRTFAVNVVVDPTADNAHQRIRLEKGHLP